MKKSLWVRAWNHWSLKLGVEKEIIVVDDGSTDRTQQIAESFAEINIVHPDPLPESWTGKNNAVIAGAKVARGAVAALHRCRHSSSARFSGPQPGRSQEGKSVPCFRIPPSRKCIASGKTP